MNPISASELKAPKHARVVAFQRVLSAAGVSCFVRTRRGDEVSAACGQLAIADDLVRKKRERDALTDSLTGTRDECDLSVQLAHVVSISRSIRCADRHTTRNGRPSGRVSR